MTLRQANLIKELPNSKSLKEAAEKAGYSYKAKNIYKMPLRATIKEALRCNPQSIIAHYEALYAQCVKDKDKATAKSILDSLCRINAMFKDRLSQELTISNADSILIGKHNRLQGVL